MLLLSDGKDESSRFSYEDTLEFARRAGVAIYSIGLAIDGKGSRDGQEEAHRDRRRDRRSQLLSRRRLGPQRRLRADPEGAALALPADLPVDEQRGRRALSLHRAEGSEARRITAKTLRGYYP